MSLLLKWAEDVLVEVCPIDDDNFNFVDEARCVYLGHSETGQEEVILQLTRKVPDGEEDDGHSESKPISIEV